MTLASGDRLDHFVISAPIGAGGMGEVYRATDERLGREVAIKVLSDEFSADAERLARFEREAKVLASLNHPNIATLYGLETAPNPAQDPQTLSLLVMELVDGEDLETRIAGQPLPIDTAIKIAKQIADGLEAAHAQGIIHRDLKPANIRIAADGTVKILDFGLAKEWKPSPGTVDLNESPTLTAEMTIQGTILGTAPYLSPEQARGEVLDRRADIWSFGCVLYEMLTGRRAFAGGSSTEILAHVLERDPDWSVLPPNMSPDLSRVLGRCLEKEPKRRLRDAGDLAIALEDISHDCAPPTVGEAEGAPRRGRSILPWLLATIAVLVSAVGWLGRSDERKTAAPPTLRFTEISPVDIDIIRNHHSGSAVAISPDGHVLVWVGATQTGTQLFARHLDEGEAQPVDGTSGAQAPFFSPDGQWIGFWAGGMLKKVAVRGGLPQPICEINHVHGPSWGDGIIVTGAIGDGSLYTVSPDDGKLQLLSLPDQENPFLGDYPKLLPDSKSMLVSALDSETLDMVNIETGERKTVVPGGSSATYLRSGHLLWAQGSDLQAAPFDLATGTVTGEASMVVAGILAEMHLGVISHYSVSDEGTLVYLPGAFEASGSSPVWVGLDGTVETMPVPPESYSSPRLSPDGNHFLLARRASTQSFWIAEPDRGFIGPVTNDDGNDYWAVWSPDGKHVIYNSQLGIVPANVWIQSVDGRGQPTRLTTAEAHHPPADITGDGRTVLIGSGLRPGEDLDILLLRMGDEPTTEPLLSSDADETHPALSPDERWIAYASDVTGTFEVYAERFPDLGGKVRISASGGQEPRWSPSGDRLYYRSTDGRKVFGIDVTGGDIIRFGPESLLFQGSFSPGPRWGANWDIHPDGDRFLMLQLERPDNPREIRVVTNWFAELERLVPTSD